MKRFSVGLAALVLSGTMLIAAAGGGRAAAASAPHSPGGLSLLGQTPYINGQGLFKLRVQVDTGGQPGDYLQVLVLHRLDNRTQFQDAMNGKFHSLAVYEPTAAVADLRPDPAGGVDIEIPFNMSNPPAASGSVMPAFPGWQLVPDSVYPVQVALYDRNNRPVGKPLDTFIVYSGSQASTGYPPLSVAVVLPITSPVVFGKNGAPGRLSEEESVRLSELVAAASSQPEVRVNLEITPEVLDALAAGGSRDQATLATLRGMVSAGQAEVFPETFVPQSVRGFVSAGLEAELDTQLNAGDAAFSRYLGVAPSRATWVVDGPLDGQTLEALSNRGANQLIVPENQLSPVPSAVMATIFGSTFAWGTQLSPSGGPSVSVFPADPGLMADFNRSSSEPVAVNQLLAEIAMIQVELPGLPRGVVVMPPAGWTPSAPFVSSLMAGLAGDPSIQTVKAAHLFGGSGALIKPLTRGLVAGTPPRAAAFTPAIAGKIQRARRQLSALASIVPRSQTVVTELESELLLSEASTVSDGQRNQIVASISKTVSGDLSEITLPDPSSITLTSTRGQIPLTILAPPSLHAQVKLVLTSQKLFFENFVPANGRCHVLDQTSESCVLSLLSRNTTLRVPVQSRSPGVFQLTVALYSPTGAWQLGVTNHDTVRSTAISNVGIVLIVVTLLTLAIWWVRDLRHGRRARQLVPSPVAGDEATLTDDPVVDAFFAKPPPTIPTLPVTPEHPDVGERKSG